MFRVLFLVSFLLFSCDSLHPVASSGRLLVDRDAPRYGRVLHHGPSRSIPLVRGDGIAEFFVRVRIGDSPGWWQVDTGAALCVVTTPIALREGFSPVTDGKIVTAAGAVDSQLGTLPSLRIGGLEIRDVTALSLDDDYANDFTINGKRGNILGILGADLLDHLDATIDLRNNLIRVR